MSAASGRGSGSGAKLGDSGQNPESITPTMTPSPALAGPPNSLAQVPPDPVSPRNVGVEMVSASTISFSQTFTTPWVCARRVASASVSLACSR